MDGRGGQASAIALVFGETLVEAAFIDERTNKDQRPRCFRIETAADQERNETRGWREGPRTAWGSTALDAFRCQWPGASPAPARGCSTVDIHGRSTDGSHLAFRRRRPGGGSRAKLGQFVANFGQSGTGLARRGRLTQ